MGLAYEIEQHLLTTWSLRNFAEGMHGEHGHNSELLNWRIAHVVDHGDGGIMVHLNVPSGSTARDQVRLLSWRIMTLSTGTFPALRRATVMTSDEQIAETTTRGDLPRVAGLGTT